MRRLAMLLLVPVCLLAANAAAAQQERIGLGLGLQQFSVLADDDLGFLTALTPQLYVPIMVTDAIMLEPGIGFFRINQSGDDPFDGEFSFSATFLRLGAGLLFIVSPSERGRVYAGPRVGILRMSREVEFAGTQDDDSRTDLLLSGVVGGEFFLVPSFSLGGEAALHYLRAGDEESDDPNPPDSDASMISIGTEFRVRWYIR